MPIVRVQGSPAAWRLFVDTGGSGGAGGRLVTNPDANFGTPPNFAYNMVADEMGVFIDPGTPGTLTVTMPDIASLSQGQMVGIYFPAGNPSIDVTFTPQTGQAIVWFDGTITPGPGGRTFPAGTIPAMAHSIWEGVPASTSGSPFSSPTWVPHYENGSFGGGGGATPDWESTLAVGRFATTNPNVNPAPTRFEFGGISSPPAYASTIGYFVGSQQEHISSGTGAFFDIGNPIVDNPAVSGDQFVYVTTRGIIMYNRNGVDNRAFFHREDTFINGVLIATLAADGSAGLIPGTDTYMEHYSPGPGQLAIHVNEISLSGAPMVVHAISWVHLGEVPGAP